MLRVGLTGGIGSGKSTVAGFFRDLGVPVLDADEIGRELTRAGAPLCQAVLEHFGPQVGDGRGGLDRSRLRRLIFQDPRRRRELEALLHPAIMDTLERRAAALDAPYVILVIPLLLEAGLQRYVDRILVVDAPETLQKQRTMQRDGVDAEAVAAILRAQWPRRRRLAQADDVIVNDADREALRRQVEALHRKYLRLAAGHLPSSHG